MEAAPPARAPVVLAGDGHPALAGQMAHLIGVTPCPLSVSAFADGETRVRIEHDVRTADVYIVQPTSTPTNERLMTLALIADAARHAGAARITAVMPYFGYARQDVISHPGEARSAHLAARMLRTAGVDRVIVLELHSPALESAFDMPVAHLRADAVTLPAIQAANFPDLTLVAPDAGAMKRAQRYAASLGTPLAAVVKTRPAPDVSAALHVLGQVQERTCLIVDDMASTGGTIAGAAQALLTAGAREVHALFIHAVMAPGALQRIRSAGVGRLIVTDTVPSSLEAAGVQVLSVAALLATAIKRLSTVR